MRNTFRLTLLFLLVAISSLSAQNNYAIKGIVKDKLNNEPLPYVNVSIWNNPGKGATTNDNGEFVIEDVKPGTYRIGATYIGYKNFISPDYMVGSKDVYITIEMEETTQALQEVQVTASPFRRVAESPLGLNVIGFKDIEKSAGANRDISKVIQSFPGVASSAEFRNDLIVRGGGPSENSFYLDGVEIPNINHFSTQGASGGPVGIINPDFIREVNFYSAAFPASRGDALSAVLDFKLKDGSKERTNFRGVVGASEVGVSVDGPIGSKTTYQVSARQSYLQMLFNLLGLPFLPKFTDAQFKVKHQFNSKNEITFIGLGAIDDMKLNTDLKDPDDDDLYILSYLPVIKQKTYTLGAVYKHFTSRSQHTLVVSQNYLNNKNIKYINNQDNNPDSLRQHYTSDEIETRFRSENTFRLPFVDLSAGGGVNYAKYKNHTKQRTFAQNEPSFLIYDTNLNMWQWYLYASAVYKSYDERFTASASFRMDANDYSSKMNNLFKQFSPRASLSYALTPTVNINAAAGRYFERPSYVTLGYKDNDGNYVNKSNGVTYISSNQYSLGTEFVPNANFKFGLEGFYKQYGDYPFSLVDSIPLASKGADYGVVGDESVVSTGVGRAYGLEFLARCYNFRGLTFLSSFTLVRSEFKDNREGRNDYIPTAWDNRFILSLTGTYALPKHWDIGAKFRALGGMPYTPYDLEKSSLVDAWNAKGRPYLDYNKFNSERLGTYTQLDIRVDKTFYMKNWMFGLYLDIQNVLGTKYKEQETYISTGKILNPTAPQDEQRYELKRINRSSGTVLPTIGVTVEF